MNSCKEWKYTCIHVYLDMCHDYPWMCRWVVCVSICLFCRFIGLSIFAILYGWASTKICLDRCTYAWATYAYGGTYTLMHRNTLAISTFQLFLHPIWGEVWATFCLHYAYFCVFPAGYTCESNRGTSVCMGCVPIHESMYISSHYMLEKIGAHRSSIWYQLQIYASEKSTNLVGFCLMQLHQHHQRLMNIQRIGVQVLKFLSISPLLNVIREQDDTPKMLNSRDSSFR